MKENSLHIKKLIQEYIDRYSDSSMTTRTLFVRENIGTIKSIASFLSDDAGIAERLYVIYHELSKNDIKCPECDNNKTFWSFPVGYNYTCSVSCGTKRSNKLVVDQELRVKRLKETVSKRTQEERDAIRRRQRETNIERYGGNYGKLFGKKSHETMQIRGTHKSTFAVIRDSDPERWIEMHKKAAMTLKNDIDENGNNHYDRIHLQKLEDIDENGLNFYERNHQENLKLDENGLNFYDRRRFNNFENGVWTKPEDKNALEGYRQMVWYCTRQQPLETLESYDKRGTVENDGYHIDHKFSILEGFKQEIEPEIIASIHNLEMLPALENIQKGSNCSITLEELLFEIDNST